MQSSKNTFKKFFALILAGVLTCWAPFALAGCAASTSTPETGKSLDEYTFEDLSNISHLIETAASPVQVAAQYGICDEQGNIADQIKRFKLKDDTVCEVRVIGIMHDTLSNTEENSSGSSNSASGDASGAAEGTNKAGLTFMCSEVCAQASYNEVSTIQGGWQASGLRSYLATTMSDNLPDYLRDRIVSVTKMTNNVGIASETDKVNATDDKLWALSVAEVNGTIHWNEQEYYGSMAPYDTVLSAEGEQYQWFSQIAGPDGTLANDKLQMTFKGHDTGWWYRSVYPMSTVYGGAPLAHYVMDSGNPQGRLAVTDTSGIAFGFCL